MGWFELSTAFGTRPMVDTATGLLFHAAGDPPTGAKPALLFVPPDAEAGFLSVADDDGTLLFFPGDYARYRFMPLRLRRLPGTSEVALCQAYWGRLLSARVPTPGEARPIMAADGERMGAAETFTLEPVPAPAAPGLLRLTEELASWAALGLTGPALLDHMERGVVPTSSDVFDSVARLLPADHLDWLARALLDHPRAAATLAQSFPADIYATTALPGLVAWLADRPVANRLVHDHPQRVEDDGIHGTYSSFPHLCSARARRTVLPRRAVAVMATIRNEGPYVLEWLAYHQAIGVQDFFIYSNNNTDGSDALLGALADAGAITWIDNRVEVGRGAQPQAYGHGTGVLPNVLDDRWLLVIDTDEFFVFDPARFGSIQDFVAWHEARPVDAIALSWVVYTSGGLVRWDGGPVTSRFTQRGARVDAHNKSMGRACKMIQARPHYPVFDPLERIVTRNASGEMFVPHAMGPSFSQHPEADAAWVNHYLLRSVEEFVLKNARNRNDLVLNITPAAMQPVMVDAFLANHCGPGLVHDTRILDCTGDMADRHARLLALPGVASAATEVHRRTRAEIDRLTAIMRTDPAFQDPQSSFGRLAALLR